MITPHPGNRPRTGTSADELQIRQDEFIIVRPDSLRASTPFRAKIRNCGGSRRAGNESQDSTRVISNHHRMPARERIIAHRAARAFVTERKLGRKELGEPKAWALKIFLIVRRLTR